MGEVAAAAAGEGAEVVPQQVEVDVEVVVAVEEVGVAQ